MRSVRGILLTARFPNTTKGAMEACSSIDFLSKKDSLISFASSDDFPSMLPGLPVRLGTEAGVLVGMTKRILLDEDGDVMVYADITKGCLRSFSEKEKIFVLAENKTAVLIKNNPFYFKN